MTRNSRFRDAYERHWLKHLDWFRSASTQYFLKQANPGKYGEPEWTVPEQPRFSYAALGAAEDVRSALLDALLVVIWGALFLSAATFIVIRYDVR